LLDAAFPQLRAHRARWACWGFVLGSACSPPPPGAPVGISDAAPEPDAPRVVAPPGPRWSDFAAAQSWPEAAPPARALVHRRDGSLIRVRVDPAVPEALAAYRALSSESVLPEGTRIIAWHETAGGALLGGYMLAKRAGVWSALEVDEHGTVMPNDRNHDRDACVRCHDMAPSDHLFGAARPLLRPQTAVEESIGPAPR